MITLKEGLLNKKNIDNINKGKYETYLVWPIGYDYDYLKDLSKTKKTIEVQDALLAKYYIMDFKNIKDFIKKKKEELTYMYGCTERPEEIIRIIRSTIFSKEIKNMECFHKLDGNLNEIKQL